jgi:hypothetical protein
MHETTAFAARRWLTRLWTEGGALIAYLIQGFMRPSSFVWSWA